jgi:hypothetical protein
MGVTLAPDGSRKGDGVGVVHQSGPGRSAQNADWSPHTGGPFQLLQRLGIERELRAVIARVLGHNDRLE